MNHLVNSQYLEYEYLDILRSMQKSLNNNFNIKNTCTCLPPHICVTWILFIAFCSPPPPFLSPDSSVPAIDVEKFVSLLLSIFCPHSPNTKTPVSANSVPALSSSKLKLKVFIVSNPTFCLLTTTLDRP